MKHLLFLLTGLFCTVSLSAASGLDFTESATVVGTLSLVNFAMPKIPGVAYMSLIPGTARANFSQIKRGYNDLGKGKVRLTQSALFLTQQINSSTTVYKFPVLEEEVNANTDTAEIRLNRNDEFIITSMFIGLYGKVALNETPTIDTKRLFSAAPINQNWDFLKVGNLYYGKFNLSVNNIKYIEKWDIKRHEYVTRTQYQGVAAQAVAGSTEPSNDWSKDGFFPMQPMVTLSGAKKNELSIELPEAISAASGTWNSNNDPAAAMDITIDRIAIVLRGYNAQNAARFQ